MPPGALSPSDPRKPRPTSHLVVTSPQQEDIYRHPAVKAYTTAHPSEARTIPKFGPYLLLQTLEKEDFYKVRLGVHAQTGEEVAVKIIKRELVTTDTTRLPKVEREVEVILSLKHPNIVRLYDVIETDKYLGIILQHSSGGELFDHILAHRYLKEKEAARIFSQLISGVWYIHQKKIAHRHLKLENLLLDSKRNVVITDFYFSNSFEGKSDDLMETSCGSPCYAAPELVISDDRYSGRTADIWSCGVILYAMLAGYLPFDDDPSNPDGDNINLLYTYIATAPLSFPSYTSADAKDLLSMILVPDPTRRANIDTIINHRWLSAFGGTPRTDGRPNVFGNTVEDLERVALEHSQQRRPEYKRLTDVVAAAISSETSEQKSQTSDGPSSIPDNTDSWKRNARIFEHTTQVQYNDVSVVTRPRSHDGRRSSNNIPIAPVIERHPTHPPQPQIPSRRDARSRAIRRGSNKPLPASPDPIILPAPMPIDSSKSKPIPIKAPQPRTILPPPLPTFPQYSTKNREPPIVMPSSIPYRPYIPPTTPSPPEFQPYIPHVVPSTPPYQPYIPPVVPSTPPHQIYTPPAPIHIERYPISIPPVIVTRTPSLDSINTNKDREHHPTKIPYHSKGTSSPGGSWYSASKKATGRLGHVKGRSSIDKLTSAFVKFFNGSANASPESASGSGEGYVVMESPTSPKIAPAAYKKARALILNLAGSPATRARLAELTGDKAQRMVDFLNQILDDQDGQMELNERKRLLALLSKLARSAQVFPACYRLKGVQCDLAKHHNFGGFGFIYKGMHKNHTICVKAVRLYSGGDNERNMKAHVKELVLWAHLSHENILPFYGVYLSDEAIPRICIVSPWIQNGDLLAYLNTSPNGPRVLLISDIIAGLQYLHESKIIHSDLKASNVLVSDTQRAMLTDFGISHVSMTLLTTTQSPAGTANWMAPEMFKEDGAPATEESDIWAFGCVCYEIFTGEMPFSNYKNAAQLIFALIKGGVVPLRPAPRDGRGSDAEDQMWILMGRCWNYDPEKRPGCREIRQFIADLEVQDNRPPVDRASFLDVKRTRFNTKINYERVCEILQQVQQRSVEGEDDKAESEGKDKGSGEEVDEGLMFTTS